MGKDIVYQLLFIFIRLTVVWWIQLVKFQSSRTRTPTIIVSWAFRNLHNSCFQKNCVKSVQIRSFYWSFVSSIQTGNGKIRTRKNSVFGHFSHRETFWMVADELALIIKTQSYQSFWNVQVMIFLETKSGFSLKK